MRLAASLLLATVIFADDEPKTGALLQTLPADGSWTSFQVNVDGDNKDVSLTWTLRSVGTMIHEGKPCRVLELEQTVDNGPQDILAYPLTPSVWRAVIPEATFGAGKEPLAKAVRIWQQRNQDPAVTVASMDATDPILAAILRGPVANRKKEEQPEKINWQRGELSCGVVSGHQEIDFGGAKLRLKSRVLRNADVPFGIAGLRQEIQIDAGGANYRVKIRGTLRDHGTDAKAKLPELTP